MKKLPLCAVVLALSAGVLAQQVSHRAELIMQRVAQKLHSIHSISAICIYHTDSPARNGRPAHEYYQTVKLRLMKPNFARTIVEISGRYRDDREWRMQPLVTYAATGPKVYQVMHIDKQFGQWPGNLLDRVTGPAEPLEGFFNQEDVIHPSIYNLKKEGMLRGFRYAGQERVEGERCDVVELIFQGVGTTELTDRRYFVGTDSLIHLITTRLPGGVTNSYKLVNVEVNPKFREASFAYTPPKGFTEGFGSPPPVAGLMPGSKAPDFALESSSGNIVRLSSFIGKPVVLNFWATWCGPCQQELPQLERLAKEHPDITFLGVCTLDAEKPYRDWMKAHKAPYITFAFDRAGMNGAGVAAAYKVAALPTNVLINPAGRVLDTKIGFSEEEFKNLSKVVDTMR